MSSLDGLFEQHLCAKKSWRVRTLFKNLQIHTIRYKMDHFSDGENKAETRVIVHLFDYFYADLYNQVSLDHAPFSMIPLRLTTFVDVCDC